MVEPCIFDIARSPPTIRALECTLRWILYFWREKGCCIKRFSFVNWNCGHPGTRQGTVCWWPALGSLRDTTSTIWRSWSWWSFFTIHDHIFLQITPPLPYWGHNKGENQKSKIQIQRSKYRCETRQLGSWFRIWLLQPPDFWLVDLHNLKSWCMTQK